MVTVCGSRLHLSAQSQVLLMESYLFGSSFVAVRELRTHWFIVSAGAG
jgi:hypothetical protein